jgi:hypothetical protein
VISATPLTKQHESKSIFATESTETTERKPENAKRHALEKGFVCVLPWVLWRKDWLLTRQAQRSTVINVVLGSQPTL